MVHLKSVLVTIVSAKTKYYEKLIISLQIISVRSNVHSDQFGSTVAIKTSTHKLPFIMLIIVLIKISIRIRPNTN